jgi:DNA-binding NarL/FixJ family response regulator
MSPLIFATHDDGLARHWHAALQQPAERARDFNRLQQIARPDNLIWLDLLLPGLPEHDSPQWRQWIGPYRLIMASSHPLPEQGLRCLDAGAAGFCHAYADGETLQHVHTVVKSGGLWVGQTLLNQLLTALHPRLPPIQNTWQQNLTPREQQVAELAAQGLSNADIAKQCDITERTVKAHLAATFEKLKVQDRLQLALKVHGIQR